MKIRSVLRCLITAMFLTAQLQVRPVYASPQKTSLSARLRPAVALFDLMNQRVELMHDVAMSKWQSRAAIEDLKREAIVVQSARVQAATVGITNIDELTRSQITIAKVVQERWQSRWMVQTAPITKTAPSLSVIRGRLNGLDAKILNALDLALPTLCDVRLRPQLKRLFLRSYISGDLRDNERLQIFNALLQVKRAN